MKHLDHFIISRTRDGKVEFVNTRTGELMIGEGLKPEDLGRITNNNLLTIPGTTTLSERLADPNWLADLRTRRLDYVRTKAKTSRRRVRQLPEMEEGEGGASSTAPKRKRRAASTGANAKVRQRLESAAGTDPVALQLAKLLGGIK